MSVLSIIGLSLRLRLDEGTDGTFPWAYPTPSRDAAIRKRSVCPLASAPFLREEVSICCHFDFPYEFSLAKRPARVSALANRTQVSAGLDFRSIIGPRLHCPSVAESFHGQP